MNHTPGGLIALACICCALVGAAIGHYALKPAERPLVRTVTVKDEIARLDSGLTNIQQQFKATLAIPKKSGADSTRLSNLQSQFQYISGVRDYLNFVTDKEIHLTITQ